MSTIRQTISDIRGINKLLSSDNTINDRVIWGEMKSFTLKLIKQQTDKRKLFQSPNIFTPLPCLEMVEAPLSECAETIVDVRISKSKQKLPKIAEGIFGLLVQYVSGLDSSVMFKESTAKRYSNIIKLQLPYKQNFFWVYNSYLYVSNPDIKAVNLSAFFEDDVPNSLLCPSEKDCECTRFTYDCDPCKNPLDQEFRCPGYLLADIKDMVARRLLNQYFQIPTDKQSDNIDQQSK